MRIKFRYVLGFSRTLINPKYLLYLNQKQFAVIENLTWIVNYAALPQKVPFHHIIGMLLIDLQPHTIKLRKNPKNQVVIEWFNLNLEMVVQGQVSNAPLAARILLRVCIHAFMVTEPGLTASVANTLSFLPKRTNAV